VDGAPLVELVLLGDAGMVRDEELDDTLVTRLGGKHQTGSARVVGGVDVEIDLGLDKVGNGPEVALFRGSVRVSGVLVHGGSSI